MSNEKSFMWGAICFAAAAFFMFLSIILLGAIVVAPAKFTTCFSIACIFAITGLAFLSGPRSYVKKLFVEENRIPSFVLIFSFLFGLYFSMIAGSYILSLIFCILQLNALLYFFCKTSAINKSTLTWFFTTLWASLKVMFSRGA